MSIITQEKLTGRVLRYSSDYVLVYAALFLICALMSARGAAKLALLCFVPAAIIVEFGLRCAEKYCSGQQSNPQI